eukprot:8868090-Prorocentrum_lima.AAC.1
MLHCLLPCAPPHHLPKQRRSFPDHPGHFAKTPHMTKLPNVGTSTTTATSPYDKSSVSNIIQQSSSDLLHHSPPA